MTSVRKHKKQLARQGLSEAEQRLLDLVGELIEEVRWLKVLGYGNQWLLAERGGVDEAERDRVFAAVARVVERDARLQQWRQRLADLRAAHAHLAPAVAAELAAGDGS